MSVLAGIEQALHEQPRKPPIANWHPPLSGTIDIRIDMRGDWYHEGIQIKRQPLVNLFASILRREDDGDFYLVTPVEKWRIRVDDTPLLAVDMEIIDAGENQKVVFRLNTQELVPLDSCHNLYIESVDVKPRPILELENGLSARLTTALFYRLIDGAERRGHELGIWSHGTWFALAQTDH